MSYKAKFRSNHVRVKDPEAFKAWVRLLHGEEIDLLTHSEGGEQLYGLGGFSAIPTARDYHEGEHPGPQHGDMNGLYLEELDFFYELGQHLQPGEIAVVTECVSLHLVKLSGNSYAVDSSGTVIADISTDDIYRQLPAGVRRAEP